MTGKRKTPTVRVGANQNRELAKYDRGRNDALSQAVGLNMLSYKMKIDCLVLGSFETNCYVLRKDEAEKDCIIIDAGLGAEGLLEFLGEKRLNPLGLLLTHGHADHIAGVTALRKSYSDIKVYVHKLDAGMLTDAARNISVLTGREFETSPAEVILEDGQEVWLCGINLKVLHTPGHTLGGVCYYISEQSILFCGDTLFADSIGRADFPGGSFEQLILSIKEKILSLPDETVACPGHGPETTIGRERVHNQYLR